ncbi:unnamed protein product, partial [Hapterophycus canaliculatus]
MFAFSSKGTFVRCEWEVHAHMHTLASFMAREAGSTVRDLCGRMVFFLHCVQHYNPSRESVSVALVCGRTLPLSYVHVLFHQNQFVLFLGYVLEQGAILGSPESLSHVALWLTRRK